MNTTLHVQKIQASIANYKKNWNPLQKKFKTVDTMNVLTNAVDSDFW